MNILIIGGAGFIGTNAAAQYAENGNNVYIFDNLSRHGSDLNLNNLQTKFGENIKFIKGDIINNDDLPKLINSMNECELILHLAAQVAVTTSVKDPRNDFNINALGTFNVLESLRESTKITNLNPTFIYASTNKVYGAMEDLKIVLKDNRYIYKDLQNGISESRQLDFHSPYGCSKGCGDQYVRDYNRIYGLNTVVFRQSCIYGFNQFGVEDQGWVAWFSIAGMLKQQITIFGDGKQVRDVLWIEDLISAYDLVHQNIQQVSGQCFNIGGGSRNVISLLELVALLNELNGYDIPLKFDDWRPGDQKVCVMDTSKINNKLSWHPIIPPVKGVKLLVDWIKNNSCMIKKIFV
jgi:CDP-paratose 2-epimerase